MSFEENIAALERLVGEMESGKLSLDEMIRRFDEGKALVTACTRELEETRRKIEKLVDPASEPPKVEPLDII